MFERSQLLTRDEEVVLITRAQVASALEAATDELHHKLGNAPSLDQIAVHTSLVRTLPPGPRFTHEALRGRPFHRPA
jgi:hypothetical protein